jgi:hypothetical protein
MGDTSLKAEDDLPSTSSPKEIALREATHLPKDTSVLLMKKEFRALSLGADTLLGLLNQTKMIRSVYPRWVQLAAVYSHETLSKLCPSLNWDLATIADLIYRSYHVSDEEFRRVAALPQRSPGWHKARKGWIIVDLSKPTSEWQIRGPLISSSVVAEILGHKTGYIRDTARALIEQLWLVKKNFETAGHLAVQRGTAMEPTIMTLALIFLQSMARQRFPRAIVSVKEVGIRLCKNYAFQAASPDLIIDIYDPDTRTHYKGGGEMKCVSNASSTPYPIIKPEYYDQCQHTCAILGLDEYMFIVLSATNVSIEFFSFDAESWARYFRSLQKFYWKALWPCIVMKTLGLMEGPTDPAAADPTWTMPMLKNTSCSVLEHARSIGVDPAHDKLLFGLV